MLKSTKRYPSAGQEAGGQSGGHFGKMPWHNAPAPRRLLQNVTLTQEPRMVRSIIGFRVKYRSPGCNSRSGSKGDRAITTVSGTRKAPRELEAGPCLAEIRSAQRKSIHRESD